MLAKNAMFTYWRHGYFRTEYWKSNARKFCDFCKCWLADNKISISYHENGKKHKDNVKNHISQLSKKSVKDFKQQAKVDAEMRKMEAAAMAAYMKDVKNNADITSQDINSIISEKSDTETTKVEVQPEPEWREVKSNDGKCYFWNNDTNETTWEAPTRYISLKEQEERKRKEAEKKMAEKRLRHESQKERLNEVKAHAAREKMKELSVKKSSNVEEGSSSQSFGPAPRTDPFGSWSTLKPTVDEPVDLQLPDQRKRLVLPSQTMEPEQVKFKERKMESLGEGQVEFKPRKFSNPRRNARQKIDDD